MDILKKTCILFPVGPTDNLGYQILTNHTLEILTKQFGHVFVFEGSRNSNVRKIKNMSSISLGKLINPIDEEGNEFFSLEIAALQQKYATEFVKQSGYLFVIQVHSNQYFTKTQLRYLRLYLIYMLITNRPWGWIGKRYIVKTYCTKTIKKLPWIVNLKRTSDAVYQPDTLQFKGKVIQAKFTYGFPRRLIRAWAPSLTDILLEYNYRDLIERYEYYFNKMGQYESVDVFLQGYYDKFKKFNFKNHTSGINQFLEYYDRNSLAKDFITKIIK
jgi:hypothetical protein